MKEIKVGRKTFEIKEGDYILWNGVCFQFCTWDRRILFSKNWVNYRCILIPKKVMKTIDLNKLKMVKEPGSSLVYYIFPKP